VIVIVGVGTSQHFDPDASVNARRDEHIGGMFAKRLHRFVEKRSLNQAPPGLYILDFNGQERR
jgi:hypothetical protein